MLRECSSNTMCHVSPVTCHMSRVTCHILFFLLLFYKKNMEEVVDLVVEGLLSTGPTPSSLVFFVQFLYAQNQGLKC